MQNINRVTEAMRLLLEEQRYLVDVELLKCCLHVLEVVNVLVLEMSVELYLL